MFGVSIGYGVGMNPETLTKPTGRIHTVDALRGFAMAVAVVVPVVSAVVVQLHAPV